MNPLERDPCVTNEQVSADLRRQAASAACCWSSATQAVADQAALLVAAESAVRRARSHLSPVDLLRRLQSRAQVRMVGAQLRRDVVYWMLWSGADQQAWVAAESLATGHVLALLTRDQCEDLIGISVRDEHVSQVRRATEREATQGEVQSAARVAARPRIRRPESDTERPAGGERRGRSRSGAQAGASPHATA